MRTHRKKMNQFRPHLAAFAQHLKWEEQKSSRLRKISAHIFAPNKGYCLFIMKYFYSAISREYQLYQTIFSCAISICSWRMGTFARQHWAFFRFLKEICAETPNLGFETKPQPQYQELRSLIFSRSHGVGSVTSSTNQRREYAGDRAQRFIVLIREDLNV